MLSKNQMVAVRKAKEKLYTGLCTVTEKQKIKKENKSTGFEEINVHENIPCRLSYKTVTNTNPSDTASTIIQTAKLFIAPEYKVKAGSTITVIQNEVTTIFKNSGEPAVYSTHQEISLEIDKRWT